MRGPPRQDADARGIERSGDGLRFWAIDTLAERANAEHERDKYALQVFATAVAAIGFTAVVPAVVLAQVSIGQPIVPSQTVLTGTLEHPINTKTAQATDQFVLDIQPPYPGDDQRLNGARVIGHIANVDRASVAKRFALRSPSTGW